MNELPNSWDISTIGDCFYEIKNGTTLPQNKNLTGTPVSRIETIQNSRFDLTRIQHIENISEEVLESYKYQISDIAFSHINSFEHVGKIALYEGIPKILIHGMNLLRLRMGHDFIEPKYAYYYMRSTFFREQVRQRVGHAVNQVSINQKNLSDVPFILAPLNEQGRIVEKLEKLLGIVAACQKRLEKIPLILKRFRQSVLAAACSGRLTADWREDNPNQIPISLRIDEIEQSRRRFIEESSKGNGSKRVKYKPSVRIDLGNKTKGIDELFDLPRTWGWVSLGQVTWDVADGPHFSPQYVDKENGVPFISARNVKFNGIDFSEAKYISRQDHINFTKRAKPLVGDVLLTKGGTTGIATVVNTEEDFSIWVHIALLKIVNDFVSPYYLRDVLTADFVYNQSQAQTHGVGNQDLGLTRMVYIAIPLPPLIEQQEIVRRVEALFKVADQIEARYNKAKAYVGKLTQSILAKAFRGELVEQDPNDEPAAALLERIRAERAVSEPANKKARLLSKKKQASLFDET